MSDVVWLLSFSFGLPSLRIRGSRSIHVAADGIRLLCLMVQEYCIVCIYRVLFGS